MPLPASSLQLAKLMHKPNFQNSSLWEHDYSDRQVRDVITLPFWGRMGKKMLYLG